MGAMLSDTEIKAAVASREIVLEPFDATRVEPASYDLRVGTWAFSSSLKEKSNLSQKGMLVIEAGEFAVVESRERVELAPNIAAQLGLRSEYARRGLLMLSGPQIDPGFQGILVVRLVNVAPTSVAVAYEAPFLTAQFFRLATPVAKPYSGPYQGQAGISDRDMQELLKTEGLTLGEVLKTLTALAKDVAQLSTSVAELRGSVGRLTWSVPLLVGLGMAIVAILVAVK